jgi:hypothetical protein
LPAAYPLRVFERCIIFTVGDQGVFLMWPLAILAFIGVWYAMRSPRMPGEKSLALWTLAAWVCVLGALIFNPSARGSDVGGGYGLRWIIPLMAPLLLFLPRALDGRGLGAKIALVPLTLWGLMIVTLGVANPWPLCSMSRFPPLHNLAEIAASRSGGYITLPDIIINETSPEPALGHFDLGMLQFNQARHVLAKRQFNEALNCADEMPTHKFDPVLARYYLGISLTETGQFLEARGNYLVLLEMAPDNVGARNNAAIMYMRWGRPADALEQARESARLDPRSVSARVLSVQALLALNRIEEAAESIRAAFADGLIDARLAGLARRLDVPVPDVQGGN